MNKWTWQVNTLDLIIAFLKSYINFRNIAKYKGNDNFCNVTKIWSNKRYERIWIMKKDHHKWRAELSLGNLYMLWFIWRIRLLFKILICLKNDQKFDTFVTFLIELFIYITFWNMINKRVIKFTVIDNNHYPDAYYL